MPEITAKFPSGSTGTLLDIDGDVMFAFTPPAAPETTPTPCPHCANREAIALYETLHTTYFRCIGCQQVWTISRTELPTASALA